MKDFDCNKSFLSGDKSNHLPSIHIPQVYYFFGFSAVFGWPALVCGPGGPIKLLKEIQYRMFGSRKYVIPSSFFCKPDSVDILQSCNNQHNFDHPHWNNHPFIYVRPLTYSFSLAQPVTYCGQNTPPFPPLG